ncbi:MAG: 4Fe-4S binding protein [Cytophagaceae bacterium]|jgi:polyferredoxin|nr:4Fe-4S binding protein [Cytophagaceae bacterium]
MLRRIRRITAILFTVLITLLFLDFTGTLHHWLGWMAKIQLIPALLAHSAAILIGLFVLTLLFGRVYCSVICPLGVMQDGVSNLAGRRKRRKNHFRYSPALSWLRYGVLALFIVALIAGTAIGMHFIVSLLDPYAAYGRIATTIFEPFYRLGNNLLAWFAEQSGSYAFYSIDVWVRGATVIGVAALTLVVVTILARQNGRTWCNTICPAGTFLGLISRFSLFKPVINAEKCTQCGLCEKKCKASCIDSKSMKIDASRCVDCFNCIDTCKFGALKYTSKKSAKAVSVQQSVDNAVSVADANDGMLRRSFVSLAGMLAFASTVKAQQLQVDGGLAEIEDKKVPDRKTLLVPPGAVMLDRFKQHCTACQLCIAACPNNVLRSSPKLSTWMQPEMTFEKGYCRPECVECSLVCPSHAINEITVADKTAISIGQAVWIRDNCIVHTDGLPCTACERHCPTGAIKLMPHGGGHQHRHRGGEPNPDAHNTPVIDNTLCIGCGACEYHCPARPFSAIYVEGNEVHHAI